MLVPRKKQEGLVGLRKKANFLSTAHRLISGIGKTNVSKALPGTVYEQGVGLGIGGIILANNPFKSEAKTPQAPKLGVTPKSTTPAPRLGGL